MSDRVWIAVALSAFLIGAGITGIVHAQQPAAPNPLDVVPPTMPFNTPYGAPITAARAQAAIQAAAAEAQRRG